MLYELVCNTLFHTGNMMSFLAIEKPKLPINSLQELVQNPDYSADVYHGAVLDLFKVQSLVL